MNEEIKKDVSKSNRNKIIIAVVVVIVLCCLCPLAISPFIDSDDITSTNVSDEVALEDEVEMSENISEGVVSEPTAILEPTDTVAPTNTPEPTNTPAPTNTPEPTNTPIPPTATPEPIVVSGTGDSLVDIEKGDWPALVHITGNAGARHFAVKNYDSTDETIGLLVNTTDAYDGVVPLDLFDNEHTYGFDVSASGDWTIEVMPLSTIEYVSSSGTIEGVGDYVFAIEGDARRATITGNADARHFAVKSYGDSGRDLLVNTTEPYEGEVRLSSGTFIIEVAGVGDWAISFQE